MTWLFALKNKLLFGGSMLAIMITLSFLIRPSPAPIPQKIHVNVQMGFYDLMSRRKEIYDASIQTMGDISLMTVTSPDDNRFVLKGKFTRRGVDDGEIFFSYTPIYFSTPGPGLMINGMVDFLTDIDIWIEPLYIKNYTLAVGESGKIFIYPQHN